MIIIFAAQILMFKMKKVDSLFVANLSKNTKMSKRGIIWQLSTEGLWTAEEEEDEEEEDLNSDCRIFYKVIFASQGGAHPTPLEAAFQIYPEKSTPKLSQIMRGKVKVS